MLKTKKEKTMFNLKNVSKMKNLKVMMMTLMMCLMTMVSFGQDRVNASVEKMEIVSDTVFKITGWIQNYADGKWYESPNEFKITYTDYNAFNNLQYLVIKKITINDKNYYLVENLNKIYRYKYPSIKEGLYINYSKGGHVLDEANYLLLINPTTNKTEIKYITELLYWRYSAEIDMINYIKTKINSEMKYTAYVIYTYDNMVRLHFGHKKDKMDTEYFEINIQEYNKLQK